jgi:flavin reductase (DIM6/NTAB) family NADH-FMN oxidoreductase RutF
VLNLASVDLVDAVDRLVLATGRNPIPDRKQAMGFTFIKDKLQHAGMTPQPSETVAPPRVAECPIQLEGTMLAMHPLGEPGTKTAAIEIRVDRTHVHRDILKPGHRHHIDPDRWRPLIMNYLEFYGLGDRLQPSRLAEVF